MGWLLENPILLEEDSDSDLDLEIVTQSILLSLLESLVDPRYHFTQKEDNPVLTLSLWLHKRILTDGLVRIGGRVTLVDVQIVFFSSFSHCSEGGLTRI